MRAVRVVYQDGTEETVPLQEAAFGLDSTFLHGPVVSATLAGRVDDPSREDRDLGRAKNPLERSAAA